MSAAVVLWRRLDTPGHDACRLAQAEDGHLLEGTAVFRQEGEPARLHYTVRCDRAWRSQWGEVRGWIGENRVSVRITRSPAGAWFLDGEEVPALEGCLDLDFGFTPATNFLALRRLALADGQKASAPAAWLDDRAAKLTLLPQTYERRSASSYWYESPTSSYAALLELAPSGFARVYPGLWQMED